MVKTPGIDSLSKSQVSRMAADLDEHVDQFRHQPSPPLARSPGRSGRCKPPWSGLAALIRQPRGWRDRPAGPPPPSGEDLGSVTGQVQRQTRPSRRWRISTG